jgi:hypothetical protein
MWARVEDGQITEVIRNPKAVTVGIGNEVIHYPKNIFEVWSQPDLDAIGFYKYVESGKKISRLYNNGEPKYTVSGKIAKGTYIPTMADTLDNLKAQEISNVERNIKDCFRNYVDDHYAEKYRTGTYMIPDAVNVYADALTKNYSAYKTAVNLASDASDLEGLTMVYPVLSKE